MGKWATYRKRGRSSNPGVPAPGEADWQIQDVGDGEASASWIGSIPAGADRWVVRGDAEGGGSPFVSALTEFVDPINVAGLDPDNYWAEASLWDFASTTQVSPWSAQKLFSIV
jgi:hypothetical protein